MRRVLQACLALIAITTLVQCGGDGVTDTDSARLAIVSGNNQTGGPGTQLPEPFVVRVTSGVLGGLGVAGRTVTWAVTSGGGSLSSASTQTDADGFASVRYTLGPEIGPKSVTAAAGGASGSPVTFSAIAVPVVGDIQGIVSDQLDTRIEGVAVRLRTRGGGSDLDVQPTGANGAYVFASVQAGDYDVLVDVPGGYGLTEQQQNPVPVTVIAGQTVTADFALRRLPVLLIECVSGATGGDVVSRGFYISSYPGMTLAVVELFMASGTAGDYVISLTARSGTYDGPVLAVAEASVAFNGDVFNMIPVEFFFPEPEVATGTIVTFAFEVLSGPALNPVFAVPGNNPDCPVIETENTSPPLSTKRRDGVEIRVFGLSP